MRLAASVSFSLLFRGKKKSRKKKGCAKAGARPLRQSAEGKGRGKVRAGEGGGENEGSEEVG